MVILWVFRQLVQKLEQSKILHCLRCLILVIVYTCHNWSKYGTTIPPIPGSCLSQWKREWVCHGGLPAPTGGPCRCPGTNQCHTLSSILWFHPHCSHLPAPPRHRSTWMHIWNKAHMVYISRKLLFHTTLNSSCQSNRSFFIGILFTLPFNCCCCFTSVTSLTRGGLFQFWRGGRRLHHRISPLLSVGEKMYRTDQIFHTPPHF